MRYPCPRTCVTHVPGLNTSGGVKGVHRFGSGTLADARLLSIGVIDMRTKRRSAEITEFKANITPPCRVKASGKVNTVEKMQALSEAGAELVGTSSGPAIVDGVAGDPDAY